MKCRRSNEHCMSTIQPAVFQKTNLEKTQQELQDRTEGHEKCKTQHRQSLGTKI